MILTYLSAVYSPSPRISTRTHPPLIHLYRCSFTPPCAMCLQCGGVEMLLSSCQLDETAPVAREWALWAVRNMCEGNPAIQQQIAGLEVQSTAVSPELQKMGMEVQLDKATGKLRLVQKQQGQQ